MPLTILTQLNRGNQDTLSTEGIYKPLWIIVR